MILYKHDKAVRLKEVEPMTIYAPMSGRLKPLEDVDDVVFSSKMMGDGIAIEPENGMMYSPVSGVITVVFPTAHVIGIQTEQFSIILHFGIDTVELQGRGLKPLVQVGDSIKAGDMLMKIDITTIRKTHAVTTMLLIEDSDDYLLEKVELRQIKAGEPIIKLKKV